MERFCFTVPLYRKITVENVDQELVNTHLKQVFKMIRMASEQGILGRKIRSMEVQPGKDNQSCVFIFDYEDAKDV